MKFLAVVCLVALGFLISDVGAGRHGRGRRNGKGERPLGTAGDDCLSFYYYQKSCPQAEDLIAKLMADIVSKDPRVPARIIRMHFHDCFVRGCDGSILLNSTSTNKAEKDAPPNNPSLQGFNVIDQIKQVLESQCPNVVSCADILTYAARESVALVSTTYSSSRNSTNNFSKSEALQNLPPPSSNVSSLIQKFASKGLSLEEMVTLSGGHSIGVSHCSSISGRQVNFKNSGKPDPTLNSNLAASLRQQCGSVSTVDKIVVMDTFTPTVLDNKYYTGLLQNKGLFTSDQSLLTDIRTLREVRGNSAIPSTWETKFVNGMTKMGEIQVLTGKQGEVRRKCSLVN
ncbi:hypothetical protein IFM89_006590 [Coptis chinensis]|uniref:Peroxidase n=1 Tax=Coptis chinensis TaxID=261450 RepID=A0A835M4K2_9MAGN|nr:hypothetical protein IFM89_006590 [Coptis chinensis]